MKNKVILFTIFCLLTQLVSPAAGSMCLKKNADLSGISIMDSESYASDVMFDVSVAAISSVLEKAFPLDEKPVDKKKKSDNKENTLECCYSSAGNFMQLHSGMTTSSMYCEVPVLLSSGNHTSDYFMRYANSFIYQRFAMLFYTLPRGAIDGNAAIINTCT